MLKPPDSLVADRRQIALTQRFLLPVLPAVEEALLAVRVDTDAILAESAPRYGKPYPYGCCLEITLDVMARLREVVARQRSPGERALHAFFQNGGEATLIWGALRGLYLQNAMQIGPLYIDVSNDTVDVNKPKVEILPLAESGFELLRDVAHFAAITERYWDVRAYTNTALPALAPLFPVLLVDRTNRVLLHSKTGYMMRLLGADGFQRSERWLREGPPPPAEVVSGLRAHCPADILAASPTPGVEAAVAVCRKLRDNHTRIDEAWAYRMIADFDRVPVVRLDRKASPIPARGRGLDEAPFNEINCLAS